MAIVLCLALTMSSHELRAQTQTPAPAAGVGAPSFEAISVKESGGTRIPVQWQGPRFLAGAIPLQTLLAVAYDVPLYQLAELPDWIRTTRWEINALASRVPTPAERWPWLRVLLEQRFSVVARTETQERPIYALLLARPDGQLGSGLRRTSTDCIAILMARAAAPGTSIPGPACNVALGPAGFRRDGMPLASLVDALTSWLQRPVVDRTGLTGLFDVDLHFRPFGASATAAATGSDEPDLMTAVTEQLGLKVESTRGPVQWTVFDRLERPQPD
jgi:uncharacterized protein (TIGR03435 family)